MNHIILHKLFNISIISIPFAFILSGCVTSEKQLDPIFADIQTLRQQITSTQQELALLRQDIKKQTQEEVQPLNVRVDTIQSSIADIKATTDQNGRDLNIINNRLDEYQERISKLDEKINSTEQSTNQRLEYSIKSLEKRIEALEKGVTASNADTQDPDSQSIANIDANSLLESAEQAYQKGEYSEALVNTSNFINKYPDNANISTAKFIQGQSLAGLKEYEKALDIFDDFTKHYPDNDKIPAVMLKKAHLYKELKKKDKQVEELKALVKKYPLSPEAEQALEELKQ